MGKDIKRSIYRYYEERAPEYDEIYSGGGPASISDPELYVTETAAVSRLLPRYAGARHIDLACGTGYWLPHYHHKCAQITLVDQSPAVLAECRRKIGICNIGNRAEIIQADLFDCPLPQNSYDSAMAGFIVSHFGEREVEKFFRLLRSILKPDGCFIILDSSWTGERALTRSKEGPQSRTLNDGRKFTILKRYFDRYDFEAMGRKFDAEIELLFEGRIFILSAGRFRRK